MSVYRALDFLLAEGLAHRIESKNAFLACTHGHESDDIVLFLLCERCGRSPKSPPAALGRDLYQAANSVGFSARGRVLEVCGLCQACMKAEARHKAAAKDPMMNKPVVPAEAIAAACRPAQASVCRCGWAPSWSAAARRSSCSR